MSDSLSLEKGSDPFDGLPEDELEATMGCLTAENLSCFFQAVPSTHSRASAKAAAQKSLLKEGLPGDSVADLIRHFSRWKSYQILLKKSLCELAPGASPDDIESQTSKNACRTFLRSAIQQYTIRVAGAHSWYKHLSIALGAKVVFTLNLTVNMYKRGGEFVKAVEEDKGVHYTWLPTDSYRARYCFFNYTLLPKSLQADYDETLPKATVHDLDGHEYIVPHSMCGPVVDITAAVHAHSIHCKLYEEALREAVRQERPGIVKGDLQPSMFGHMQSRFRNRSGLRLPSQVAEEIETIAIALLVAGEDPGRASFSTSNVMEAQQIRERKALALSLRELCLRNFGKEWTPSEEEVVFSLLPV